MSKQTQGWSPDIIMSRVKTANELKKLGYPVTLTSLKEADAEGFGPQRTDIGGRGIFYTWRDALAWAVKLSAAERRKQHKAAA